MLRWTLLTIQLCYFSFEVYYVTYNIGTCKARELTTYVPYCILLRIINTTKAMMVKLNCKYIKFVPKK